MKKNTFTTFVGMLKALILHCISIVTLIVFILITICLCFASIFLGIISGFLLFMLWRNMFIEIKKTTCIKDDEKQEIENFVIFPDTNIKTNNGQTISKTESVHETPSKTCQTHTNQNTQTINPQNYHTESDTNNLYHYDNPNIENKVIFLTHSDIEQLVLHSEVPIKLIDPKVDSISAWESDYGYNKNDINYWTHTEIKNSYKQIRKNFLKGTYYDLSSSSYNLYWKILVYDVTDALREFPFEPSFCAEVFSILNSIAENDHKLLKKLAETYVSPMPTIKPSNLEVYKAIVTKNPYLAEEKSWITLQMINDNIPYDTFCKLHQIRFSYWFGFSIHKTPAIKQYLTTLYLNVLAHKTASNKLTGQHLEYDFSQDEYRICKGIIQLCFDEISHYFHNEQVSLYLPEELKQCEHNFPNGICACIESEFCKLLPLSKEAWVEIYHNDAQLWKPKYELLRNNLLETKDYITYLEKVDELYALASKAPNIYLMLADVVKRISKKYTEKAIIYYFNARLIKDETKIVKPSLQHLFPNELVHTKFESILKNYKQTNDYNKAIEEISKLYKPERKKISISEKDLQKKESLYKQTISMLDNIMEDGEDDFPAIQKENKNTTFKKENSPDQILLTTFIENNFILSKDQVKQIASKFHIMPSVMIDSINEKYYDVIDDNIIEDNDNQYTINSEYINIIKSNE